MVDVQSFLRHGLQGKSERLYQKSVSENPTVMAIYQL